MNPEPAPEKPRTQVVEETRESLTLLDQDRLTRDAKLAQESGPLSEGHEVRFAERHFQPRHAMGIEEIRDAVDALEVKRRLPLDAPLPPLEEPPAPRPHIRDEHRDALAPLVEGELVSVEVVYRSGAGDVVEAVSESRGVRARGLYVIAEGVARPADDIESRVDALPTPEIPQGPRPEPPSQPAAAPPPEPAKKRFGFGKKAEPQPESKPKKRFGFGRK